MFTDKIEIDDLKIYVGDSDKVKIIKGEDDVKVIDTTNLIELYNEKIENQNRAIKYYQNKIRNRKFMKQILADKLIFIYLIFLPIVLISMHNTTFTLGFIYALGFKIVLDASDKLDKSARDDCMKKINKFNENINKYSFDLICLQDKLYKLEKRNEVKEAHIEKINDIEELKKIKQTFIDEYNIKEKEKTLIKR